MTDEDHGVLGVGTENAWNWFYGLACECVDAVGRDYDLGLERMVSRLVKEGIPRQILEDECKAYIHTAIHREELDGMEPEEIIEKGLGAGIEDSRRRRQ